ncbi:hypothetical protein EV195_104240 [Tenacibaculum skagerrakense]|uniref:Uncharacterized protein n=1 Tax=Tenacibaculum skagerrakense TaxID=186571 RepID=A0A4R2NTL9_9FLAO|nr:hypothetical protein [Tenacibaculum skagerrakense]TCP25207.1 hypothetical protein EV195_104240 [Tenacibaculum skagerrakense]
MFNLSEESNPTDIAKEVAKKYTAKGYKLDFSLESLELEIDKIINNPITYKEEKDINLLIAELTVYVGETFRTLFNTDYPGQYFEGGNGNAANFYTYYIEKNGERFHPSHFFEYKLPIQDFTKNQFKEYLYYSYATIDGEQKVLPGVLYKFLKD